MRLIDADALKRKVFKFCIEECTGTEEAKPVVHAHWKEWGCEGTVCSNCYGRVLYECDEQEKKSKYCPHCGAQMDEKEGE